MFRQLRLHSPLTYSQISIQFHLLPQIHISGIIWNNNVTAIFSNFVARHKYLATIRYRNRVLLPIVTRPMKKSMAKDERETEIQTLTCHPNVKDG